VDKTDATRSGAALFSSADTCLPRFKPPVSAARIDCVTHSCSCLKHLLQNFPLQRSPSLCSSFQLKFSLQHSSQRFGSSFRSINRVSSCSNHTRSEYIFSRLKQQLSLNQGLLSRVCSSTSNIQISHSFILSPRESRSRLQSSAFAKKPNAFVLLQQQHLSFSAVVSQQRVVISVVLQRHCLSVTASSAAFQQQCSVGCTSAAALQQLHLSDSAPVEVP